MQLLRFSGETDSCRYRYRRIISLDDTSLGPSKPHGELYADIRMNKWAYLGTWREVIWSGPRFPWIFLWEKSKRYLLHIYIVREYLYPLNICSSRKPSIRRNIYSISTTPVWMTDPCIDVSIESTRIIGGITRMTLHANIFPLKLQNLYVSETATSSIYSCIHTCISW